MTRKSERKSLLAFWISAPFVCLSVVAVFFIATGSLRAQSPSYAGIYVGQTSDNLGGFALFVDANQNAVLIGGYLYNDDSGDAFYSGCIVDSNGNGNSDIGNVTVSFTISPDGSVNFNGNADNNSFSYQIQGSLVSSGPFLSVAGLYRLGLLTAIVAPNGWIYRDSPSFGGGGRVQITAYGQPETESSLGHNVNAYVLNQNATLAIGSSALNRVDSLPAPPPVLGTPQLNLANGQFIFSASGLTPGSTNILQTCADISPANWVSVATNVATASTLSFTNAIMASRQFYRLAQLP